MKIVGLLLNDILETITETQEGYLFHVGDTVEITTIVKENKNKLLSTVMCSSKKEDKYMMRYTPYNKILFDKDYIEECIVQNKIIPSSMFVNTKMSCVQIGRYEKYPIKEGSLMLSCRLSGNYMIENMNELITYGVNSEDTLLDKVKLLAVGTVNGKGIIGLFYIPKERGIAYKCSELESQLGISSVNRTIISCKGWKHYTIDDWLKGCKIR